MKRYLYLKFICLGAFGIFTFFGPKNIFLVNSEKVKNEATIVNSKNKVKICGLSFDKIVGNEKGESFYYNKEKDISIAVLPKRPQESMKYKMRYIYGLSDDMGLGHMVEHFITTPQTLKYLTNNLVNIESNRFGANTGYFSHDNINNNLAKIDVYFTDSFVTEDNMKLLSESIFNNKYFEDPKEGKKFFNQEIVF